MSNLYSARPSLDDLLADPVVDAALRQAWTDSLPFAPEVPFDQPGSMKREQGGRIVWNRKPGTVEVIRVLPGARDGLPTIQGTRPTNDSEREVVAWFHTHPNTLQEGYLPDPSPADVSFTCNVALVGGLVETHDGRFLIPHP